MIGRYYCRYSLNCFGAGNLSWTQVQGHHERHLLIQPVAKAKPKFKINCTSWAPATFIHSHHAGMNGVAINRARHKAVLSIAGLRRCNSMWTCCPVQIFSSCLSLIVLGGLDLWSLDPRGSPRPKSFLRKRILKMARKSMVFSLKETERMLIGQYWIRGLWVPVHHYQNSTCMKKAT